MAERELGRLLRDPRRRLGPRLPPPRERDRPVRGGRPAVRADLDAQRDGRDRRGEDVEIGGQHLPALRGARPLRARGGRRLPDLRALPAAAGVRGRTRWSRRWRRSSGCGISSESIRSGESPGGPRRSNSGEAPARPPRTLRRRCAGELSAMRWLTTSIRRGRWLRCLSWWGKRIGGRLPGASEVVSEMLELVGLGSLGRRSRAAADDRGRGADGRAGGGSGGEGLRARRRDSRPSWPSWGGTVRDSADGPTLVPKA